MLMGEFNFAEKYRNNSGEGISRVDRVIDALSVILNNGNPVFDITLLEDVEHKINRLRDGTNESEIELAITRLDLIRSTQIHLIAETKRIKDIQHKSSYDLILGLKKLNPTNNSCYNTCNKEKK